MHPNSFLARPRPFAFASSSTLLLPTAGEMPPPYDDHAPPSPSQTRQDPPIPAATTTALAATPPAAQPPMTLPLSLSARRCAPSPPKPLITPPPYCASPPLVPVESRSPDLAGADDLKGATRRRGGPDDDDGEDKYLALATPAQRSYFVTLSGLFEGAAVQSREGASPVEEKEVRGARGRQDDERDRGCGYSCCTVS
ncbi:hypothetical protein JCM8208_006918 [Rhodotorula glutinis]